MEASFPARAASAENGARIADGLKSTFHGRVCWDGFFRSGVKMREFTDSAHRMVIGGTQSQGDPERYRAMSRPPLRATAEDPPLV